MESKKTFYVNAELDIISFKGLDIITTSNLDDPNKDSLDQVDKDENSWD